MRVQVSAIVTPAKRAYRFREFCETHGVGRDRAYQAIRDGKLLAHKNGKATIILCEHAEAYLASLPRLQLPSAQTEPLRAPLVPGRAR